MACNICFTVDRLRMKVEAKVEVIHDRRNLTQTDNFTTGYDTEMSFQDRSLKDKSKRKKNLMFSFRVLSKEKRREDAILTVIGLSRRQRVRGCRLKSNRNASRTRLSQRAIIRGRGIGERDA